MTKPGIIKLHGRQYKTVALRVQEFREKHPIIEGWGLCTKIMHSDSETVLFRAAVVDPQGREVAIGYAEEKRTNRGINSTSALEVCETSALGRALAAAGYGGSEYASADELVSAISQQRQKPPALSNGFLKAITDLGLTEKAILDYCSRREWGHPSTWESDARRAFIKDVRSGAFPALYTPEGGE